MYAVTRGFRRDSLTISGLVLVLSAGCGGDSETETEAETETATEAESESETATEAESETATEAESETAAETEAEAEAGSEAPHSPMGVTAGAHPARFYFWAGPLSQITDGGTGIDDVGFTVRLDQPREVETIFPNEPRYPELDRLARALFEDEGQEDAVEAACAAGEGVPEPLRIGAAIDALGPDGWSTTRITRCTAFAYGHHHYLGFALAGAPEGVRLAAVHADARPRASLTDVAEELPGLEGDALAHLRAEIARLGMTAPFPTLDTRNTGRFAAPDGQVLVHIGFPGDSGEGDEPGWDRAWCGNVGSCGPTGLVLFDEDGDESLAVLGSGDERETVDDLGAVWTVRAVFRDGHAIGVITDLDSLGSEQILLTRIARGRLQRQTLFYSMGG